MSIDIQLGYLDDLLEEIEQLELQCPTCRSFEDHYLNQVLHIFQEDAAILDYRCKTCYGKTTLSCYILLQDV